MSRKSRVFAVAAASAAMAAIGFQFLPPVAGNSIASGAVLSGTHYGVISSSGSTDSYAFTPSTAGPGVIGTCSISTSNNYSLAVYASNGSRLASATTASYCNWVSINMSAGQTYTVKTTATSGSGNYRSSWSVNSAPIVWNPSGNISTKGGSSTFSVPTLSAGSITISTCAPSGTLFNLYLDSAQGKTLASSTASSNCQSLSYQPGARDLYRLREVAVSGTGSWSGTMTTDQGISTAVPTVTATSTASPAASPTIANTSTPTATLTPHVTATASFTPTMTSTPRATATPNAPPSSTPAPTATSTAAGPTATPSSNSGFVTHVGSQLVLGGKPYRFDGLNIYNANSNGGCVVKTNLDQDLTQIGSGVEAMRAWFFQPFATVNGQRDWSAFDHTLAVAQAHNVKVIVTLANEWPYCDSGSQRMLPWFQGGYKTQIDPGSIVPYQQWVSDTVTRYRNNPTILMWQLVNEASAHNPDNSCTESTAAAALRSFADDVGGMVHALDPNHLVSMGSIQGQCGTSKSDYQYVYSSAGTDVCDYHDYNRPTAPMPGDAYNGLQAEITRCQALGKPIMVGETGINPTQSNVTLSQRAADFDAKMNAQFGAGVAGILMWDWAEYPNLNSHEIGPNDPSLGLLTKY